MDLPEIIFENKNVCKFLDLDIRTRYVDPSWAPPSVECNANYPYSGLIQHRTKVKHACQLISITISRKWESELPKIIIENINVYRFLDFDLRKTYFEPSWTPFYRMWYSGLIQHACLTKIGIIISRKWYAEFPKMIIENRNIYKFIFACFPTFLQKYIFLMKIGEYANEYKIKEQCLCFHLVPTGKSILNISWDMLSFPIVLWIWKKRSFNEYP